MSVSSSFLDEEAMFTLGLERSDSSVISVAHALLSSISSQSRHDIGPSSLRRTAHMLAFRIAAEVLRKVKRHASLKKGDKVASSVLIKMNTDGTKQCVKLDGFLR